MSETLIVLKREFLERVRTRSFLISTLLVPLLFIGIYTIPFMLGEGGGGEQTLVVVDEGPEGIGETVIAGLNAPREEGSTTYRIERVIQPLTEVRDELTRRTQQGEIDGYVHIPPDVLDASQITYRARNVSNFEVLGDLRRVASEAVQATRLRRAGLEATDVAALVRRVDVSTTRITDQGEEAGSAETVLILAYVAALLIYMMILLYGINVMRSVLEEKTNRIAEVIVSSMRASHLMFGKIAGVAAVALLQVGIWVVIVVALASQSDAIARGTGISAATLDSFTVRPGVGLAILGFFVLGFLLYSSLFAALGAAVTSEQEGQQFQMVVMVPLIVPLMFLVRIANDPLGTAATALGLIPFTAPVTMSMRMAITKIPAAQILGSLLLLAATTVFLGWLAGKIYRVGILSTGKKPTLREVGRWLRAA